MQHAELQVLVAINRWLFVGLVLAQAVLVVRLFCESLVRQYSVFTAYLVTEVIWGAVLLIAAGPTLRYAKLYRIYLVLTGIMRIGVVCELYERICEHFPGIGAFRLRMAGGLALIGALAAFFSIPSIASHWGYPQQAAFLVMTQYESELIAVLLLGMWLFFKVFGVTPIYRRNLLIHWRITTLYFLVDCVSVLAALLTGLGQTVQPINTAMLVADLILVVAWAALLNRRGEELPELPRFSPAELQALEQRDSELTDFITQMPRQIATRLK